MIRGLLLNPSVKTAHGFSSVMLRNYPNVKGVLFLQSKLREKVCKWLVPPIDGFAIISTLSGVELLVDTNDWIGKQIYWYGDYEAGTLAFLKKYLKEGDVFLDVGAYIGDISCAACRMVGSNGFVYAVEPNPKNSELLTKNFKINGFNNAVIFNFGLSDTTKFGELYSDEEGNSGASSFIRTELSRSNIGLQVNLTTLDILIREKKIRIPTFIKIDVEGYEIEVLRGAKQMLRSYSPILCIEYVREMNREKGSSEDIFDFINSLEKYSIYRLEKNKFFPSKIIKLPIRKTYLSMTISFVFPLTRRV
jgi:FkbM family methyltransferase